MKNIKKGKFEFQIISAYDREKLTCEIIFKNEMTAEISQEEEELFLEIYPPQSNKCWGFPLKDFQLALEEGIKYLKNGGK